MGVTWAVGWAPIGAIVGAALHLFIRGSGLGLGPVIALNAGSFAALGFLGGTAFAGVLRLAEGRRHFHELSLSRFTGWGAVGGALLGGGAVTLGMWGGSFGLLGASMVGAATVLGAASAAGTLALARGVDDPTSVDSGDAPDVPTLAGTERDQIPKGT